MTNITPKPRHLFIVASALTVILAAHTLNKHFTLKQQLTDYQHICEIHISQLQEAHLAQLEELQRALPLTSAAPLKPKQAENIEKEYSDQQPFVKPVVERYDESLEEIVVRKYRFLLNTLQLDPAVREELLQLLSERESLLLQLRDARTYEQEILDQGEIAQLEFQITELDSLIEQLLDPDDGERYTLLKDSDKEQHHFHQYTLGISGLFPLSNQQQQTVLFTRLEHKQIFEQAITATGIDMDYPLTQQQRIDLLAKAQTAAQIYKRNFLEAIRPHLDHNNYPMDQYTLLENYSNTEFHELMTQLREKIEQRGLLN